jgi:chromosome segregation protein
MRIRSVEAEGFRGIKNPLRIEFPRDFLIVSGRNGAGKSTICDLIEFALTGDIEKHYMHTERSETLSNYLWWRGEGPPSARYVRLTLVDDDGNDLVISRDANSLSSPSQEDIAAALCDHASAPTSPLSHLCHTSLIRDEILTHFSVDFSETERFDFVRSAVGTHDLASLEARIASVSAELDRRLKEITSAYQKIRGQVAALIANISESQTTLVETQVLLRAEGIVLSLVGRGSIEKEGSIAASGRRRLAILNQQVTMLHELERSLQQLQVRRTELETPAFTARLNQVAADLSSTDTRLREVTAERLTAGQALANISSEEPSIAALGVLVSQGEFLGLSSGKCPLCNSIVSPDQFSKHLAELRTYLTTRNSLAEDLAARTTRLHSEERQLTSTLQQLRADYQTLSTALVALDEDYNRVAALAISNAVVLEPGGRLTAGDVSSAIAKVQEEIKSLETAIGVIEAGSSAQRVAAFKRELASLQHQSLTLEKELETVGNALESSKRAGRAVKRLDGEIIDEKLASLSPLLAELYFRLRPHIDWPEIQYHVRGDIRRFLSLSVGSDLNPRFMFSSGQRRAMGLAFLLAVHLSRPWARLRTLILDDPVQHVDDFRSLHLGEVLAAIRQTGRQILCTVEDPAMASFLCRRLGSDHYGDGGSLSLSYDAGSGVRAGEVDFVSPTGAAVLRPAG